MNDMRPVYDRSTDLRPEFESRPPAQAEPFVRVLGAERTVAFLRAFGGAEMRFYGRVAPHGRLARFLGGELAQELADQAGHLPPRIPLAQRWTARWLAWRGASVASIARQLHVTDKTVRGYLAERRR